MLFTSVNFYRNQLHYLSHIIFELQNQLQFQEGLFLESVLKISSNYIFQMFRKYLSKSDSSTPSTPSFCSSYMHTLCVSKKKSIQWILMDSCNK